MPKNSPIRSAPSAISGFDPVLAGTGVFVGFVAGASSLTFYGRSETSLGVFIVVPLLIGAVCASFLGLKERRTFNEGAVATIWALLAATGLLMASAVIMNGKFDSAILPIFLPLPFFASPAAFAGTAIATLVRNRIHDDRMARREEL
ncbi:hypothetical protein EON81_13370 [bacterium]|nr:MAG: hypothetical protein EON81_13370 [bacterium]